jgi:carbon monoxide dehydrogenase subunit G
MQFDGNFEVLMPVNETNSFTSHVERIMTIIPSLFSLEKAGENCLTFGTEDRKVNESAGNSASDSGSWRSFDLNATYSPQRTDGRKTTVRWDMNLTVSGMVAAIGHWVINGIADRYNRTLTGTFGEMFEYAGKH